MTKSGKITEQGKYKSAAQRSQRKKDLKDVLNEVEGDVLEKVKKGDERPEKEKKPKPSEPKPSEPKT
jgi:hypothetical protein